VRRARRNEDALAGRTDDAFAIDRELDLAFHDQARLTAEIVAVDLRHRPQLDAAKPRADLWLDDEVRQVRAVVVHIDRHDAYGSPGDPPPSVVPCPDPPQHTRDRRP